MKTYDATDTNAGIFESEKGSHLNLITCSGDWDPITMNYTKRLVVFTDVISMADHIATVPIQEQWLYLKPLFGIVCYPQHILS